MIAAAYIFILLFSSIFVEVLVGSHGFIFPLTALTIFYLTMVFGWKVGAVLGFFSGVVIDMLYGREIPVSPFSLVLVSGISIFWLFEGETKIFFLHVVPGMLTGIAVIIPLAFVFGEGMNFSGIFSSLFSYSMSIAVCALFLPVLILILDEAAHWFGMELYSKAKENIGERI